MIRHNKASRFCLLILLLTVIVGFTATRLYANDLPMSDAERAIATLRDNIAASEEYRFTAQIEQTLIPRATTANIGRSAEYVDSQLTAIVKEGNSSMELRFEGNALPPLMLEQEGAYTFLLQNGKRTLIENPIANSDGSGSFAGYLHAAINIVVATHPDFPDFTIYQFDIDGEQYAAHLVEQMRASLSPSQQYRSGLPALSIQKMSGTGEIWLDADGILRRQILDIHTPEVNEQYDTDSHIIVDYKFDDASTAISALSTLISSQQSVSGEQLATIAPQILIVFAAFLVAYLLIQRQSKLRMVLPIFLAFVMLATPALQSAVYAYENSKPTPQSLLDALGLNSAQNAQPENILPDRTMRDPHTSFAQQTESTCGVSDDLTTDSDDDGLTDYVENCLGTNPYSVDSDNDLITDTLEINGFVFTDTLGTARTFYSDPLNEDTNLDGYSDLHEWPAPIGAASEWDIDGDDIPNLWDFDNDGDGVNDDLDLAPDTVTTYYEKYSLLTNANGTGFDGYQLFEFQIQPENPDHMRYSLATLDWPYDTEGNIVDLDDSRDDISLVPMMHMQVDDAPTDELLDMYNVSAFYDVSLDGYDLYVPLTPIGDGGRIDAFAGKLAYDATFGSDIALRRMQLVWVVNMMMDEEIEQVDGNGDVISTEIVSTEAPLTQYIEDFRFAGLEVSMQENFDYAILGTPNSQANNRTLFQLMMGMDIAYLQTAQPDLDTIVSRFSSNSTTPMTQTWGIAPSEVTVFQPNNPSETLDQLAFDSAEATVNFLINNGYAQDDLASLIIATQGDSGRINLSEMSQPTRSRVTVKVNLNQIPVATTRTIRLPHFVYADSAWQSASVEELTDALFARHDFDAILASLQQTYPDMDEAGLMLVLANMLAAWDVGITNMVRFDGADTVAPTLDETRLTEQIDLDSAADIATYLIEVMGLGVENEGFVFDDRGVYAAFIFTNEQYGHLNLHTYYSISIGRFALTTYWTIGYLRKAYKWVAPTIYKSIYYAKHANYVKNGAKFANKVSYVAQADGTLVKVVQGGFKVKKALWMGKHARTMAKIGVVFKGVLDVIFLAVEITFIWLAYANFQSLYQYEYDFALAFAITSTIIAIVFAVLSLFPLGLLFVLAIELAFLLMDLIMKALGYDGFDTRSTVITGLTSIVVNFDPFTRIEAMDYAGIDVETDGALMVGGKMVVSDQFEGVISTVDTLYQDQLSKGESYGYFEAKADDDSISVSTDRDAEGDNCAVRNVNDYLTGVTFKYSQTCSNPMEARYKFNEAGINLSVEFKHKAIFKTRYQRCNFFGTVCNDGTETTTIPDALDEDDRWGFTEIFVDVLPDTIDGLWNWSALEQTAYSDVDGDGLAAYEESNYGTNPALWDTDGDGLSDEFELASLNDFGTDPADADSDDDGLNDGIELAIGTLINDSDSDDDGLLDGEEFFHWDGANWVGGGWTVTVNGTDYFVLTTPLAADADGDNLNDSGERFSPATGSSPDAANADTPRFTFAASPMNIAPNDRAAVYARQGDIVTATASLYNIGVAPITDTVELCLPSGLTNINVTASGDRVPATTIDGDCYQWDFSGNNLLFLQTFNVDVSATAASGTLNDSFRHLRTIQRPRRRAPHPRDDPLRAGQYCTRTLSLTEPISSEHPHWRLLCDGRLLK